MNEALNIELGDGVVTSLIAENLRTGDRTVRHRIKRAQRGEER